MSGAALLLAAAASTASPYPVQAILTAFGEVCFDLATVRPYGLENAPVWKKVAVEKGWVEQRPPSAPAPDAAVAKDASARTYNWAMSLDYGLLMSMSTGLPGRLTVQSLFRKRIAGRDIYLSIVGIDANNPELAECRLRDPLGDGIYKSPIGQAAVERWLGHPVKKSRGLYRGTQYSWLGPNGAHNVRLHFGFDGRPFGVYGARYDPYALYGMTLVRSDYSKDTII